MLPWTLLVALIRLASSITAQFHHIILPTAASDLFQPYSHLRLHLYLLYPSHLTLLSQANEVSLVRGITKVKNVRKANMYVIPSHGGVV
jgi:hypothetical protein